ncbi:MAG: tRNA dimethylallyltransferase [Thermoleophilaceae bacterium]
MPGDGKRLVRTLELLELGHPPPRPADDSQLWTSDTRHPTLLVGLTMERAALYAAIDARVDAMVAAGVVAEVQRAEAAGVSRTARHALGFEELLRGDIEAMKQRTRNYARRQLTWMRKLEGVRLTDVGERGTAGAGRLDRGSRGRRPRLECPPCDSRSGRRWATTTR